MLNILAFLPVRSLARFAATKVEIANTSLALDFGKRNNVCQNPVMASRLDFFAAMHLGMMVLRQHLGSFFVVDIFPRQFGSVYGPGFRVQSAHRAMRYIFARHGDFEMSYDWLFLFNPNSEISGLTLEETNMEFDAWQLLGNVGSVMAIVFDIDGRMDHWGL